MKLTMVRSLFLLILLPLLISPGFGQVTTATIYGIVSDGSGARVPGATVTATDEQTQRKYGAVSGDEGEFTLPFVPVGRYTIEVELIGFKKSQQTGLDLSSGQKLRFETVLQVGEATESVTVTAAPPVLQNASVTLTTSAGIEQARELPLGSRSFVGLVNLQPGAQAGGGKVVFNGLGAGGTTITVDGTDAQADSEAPTTSMFGNFNRIQIISSEAIQEVQTSKGITSAETARSFGGNLNIITRSGTNDFHGSLFHLFRNEVLDARPRNVAAGTKKPPVRYNQFGGSFGGPIIKNKLFFFGVYEGYRDHGFSTFNSTIMTKELRDKTIAVAPGFKSWLDRYPLPTEPYEAGADWGVYRGIGLSSASDNHAVVRVDYSLTDSDNFSGRYTRSHPKESSPRIANAQIFDGKTQAITGNWIHGAPTWSSETRFGFNSNDVDRANQAFLDGAPEVQFASFADQEAEIITMQGHSWTVEELMAMTLSRHSIKFGGLFLQRRPGRENLQNPRWFFNTLDEVFNNDPSQVEFTVGTAKFHGRAWEFGGLIQDDFQLRPDLMLNLGMRYEYYSVYKEQDGRFFNPDGLSGALALPTVFRPRDSAYNADRNNFSPRLGFAWSPGGKKQNVIRAGVGVFTAPFSIYDFQTQVFTALDLPFRYSLTRNELRALDIKFPTTIDEFLQKVQRGVVARSYDTTDPNIRSPYNFQWTFDYQRLLAKGLVLQTGYVGTRAKKLKMGHYMNQPDRLTGIRPTPGVLNVYYMDGAGIARYDAWQSSLRKAFSDNLSLNINYTWSKWLSIGGGDPWLSGPTGGWYVQDEGNQRLDKGLNTGDVTHRFTADWIYELPADKWLNLSGVPQRLIGGWQVTGILYAQSGSVLNLVQRPGAMAGGQRPDYVGGSPYGPEDNVFQWLNKSAFALVPVNSVSGLASCPGNVSKNAFRGPSSWSPAISLAKNIVLHEGMKLQFRADMFNAFNHRTLGNPELRLDRPRFGQISSEGGNRTIQFQTRLSF